MKLRMRGNSIRLRLTRSEVDRFAAGEAVAEAADLSPAKFVYELVAAADAERIAAAFDGGRLTISVPEREAKGWAAGEAVGMEAEHGEVSILIEKDFACARPRSGEDESDMFEHPSASAAC